MLKIRHFSFSYGPRVLLSFFNGILGSGFMVKSLNLLMQQLRPVTLSVARLQSVYWMRLISF